MPVAAIPASLQMRAPAHRGPLRVGPKAKFLQLGMRSMANKTLKLVLNYAAILTQDLDV